MDIKNRTRKTSKGFYSITEVAAWIGYIATAGIVLIVFVDVCGRYLLNIPFPDAYALVQQTMGVLAGFAILQASVKRGHVALDLIIRRFSRRTQAIMQSIFSLLGFGASVAVACRLILFTLGELKPLLTTDVLHIATPPFTFMLAIAIFLCGLAFLIQAFHPVVSEETIGEKEAGVNEP